MVHIRFKILPPPSISINFSFFVLRSSKVPTAISKFRLTVKLARGRLLLILMGDTELPWMIRPNPAISLDSPRGRAGKGCRTIVGNKARKVKRHAYHPHCKMDRCDGWVAAESYIPGVPAVGPKLSLSRPRSRGPLRATGARRIDRQTVVSAWPARLSKMWARNGEDGPGQAGARVQDFK